MTPGHRACLTTWCPSYAATCAAEAAPTGRLSQTAQYRTTEPTPHRVRIMRRHHPLEGIEFDVVRGGGS